MAMQQQSFGFLKETAYAVLSEDRVYRYVLYRSLDGEAWNHSHQDRCTVCFVMLNPSTADEHKNDPTIEKLIKYARRWGYQRLAVVNLFAYRETDSKKLRSLARQRDLVGPENNHYLRRVTDEAHLTVCAWGTEGDINDRGDEVKALLGVTANSLKCFKLTADGHPTHPLYQPDAAELIDYP